VIEAPFGASSQVAAVQLPGALGGWQSHGIVFDRNGRAFVYHSIGISVLEPPYETIAFTIPVSDNGSPGGGEIAIAPDDQTLLVTKLRTAFTYVGIFHAPFSAASIQETVQIPNSLRLNALAVAPDNSFAFVTSYTDHQLFVIAAPLTASSAVEQIPMPAELNATGPGFEHVAFHPGGKLVVLSGGSAPPPNDPYVFVEAPFTAAEATVHLVWPAGNLDRGSNAAIFLPAELFADGFESGDSGSWSQTNP
jgi:DNA-binding beta-propeller fold protein YncE